MQFDCPNLSEKVLDLTQSRLFGISQAAVRNGFLLRWQLVAGPRPKAKSPHHAAAHPDFLAGQRLLVGFHLGVTFR